MPKIKTHRGAAKRFELTKSGKVKRAKAYKSHLLTKKSSQPCLLVSFYQPGLPRDVSRL